MIKRYLFQNYYFILKQYRKLRRRMERNLQSSTPYNISKRDIDFRKLKSLGEKLVSIQPSLKPAVVAGLIALGAATTPALAQGPFVKQTGLDNPFENVGSEGFSVPRFVDLDNDGDLDLVVGGYGYYSPSFFYYKNTGTSTNPVYTIQEGDNSPFGFLNDFYAYYAPTFGDLDGDGDFDMILGEDSGYLRYFKNTGSKSAPVFTEQFDENNPLASLPNLGDELIPNLVDIDNDGDLDLLVGEEDYTKVIYLKNTGTASAPVFEHITGSSNPLNNFSDLISNEGYRAMPSFADIDGDGDFDAIVGYKFYGEYNNYAKLAYLKNTGSKTDPIFTLQTGADNPFNELDFNSAYVTPEFADVDGDGDLDLVAGLGWEYGVLYFENTQPVTGVSTKSISKDLSVYPNPASSSIQLSIKNNITGNCEIIMKTIDGLEISRELVNKTSNDFSHPMNLESLSSGIYIVEIVNNNNVGVVKFVKN